MLSTMSGATGWGGIDVLAEPTRRTVYEAVRRSHASQTRDDVATATGISRRLAAFHLDLLADAGLLDVDYARPPGRRGPGAGRPAKRYRATDVDLTVTVPPRRYDLIARLLARSLARVQEGEPPDAPAKTAYEEGERIGTLRRSGRRTSAAATLDGAATALADLGFDPDRATPGCIRLRNCPFHVAADVAPDLVCGMNESFISGLLAGLGAHRSVHAELAPAPPDCCVVVRSGPSAAQN